MAKSADRIQAVFAAAVELPSSAARAAYLDQACANDPVLRQRVEDLLRAHEQANPLHGRPEVKEGSLASTIDPTTTIRPGMIVGSKYKLLEAIGEGGMGTVWLAQQSAPVKRQVAIKLIKAGMDSRQVLARFDAERQALALMDHPNIARVYDAGVTEQGRPYFVMEYVKGIPLTDYCDHARLSLPERLTLFAAVCKAVQHAHQKGIIHRDLKPSNILVCLYDGQPVPKVIDFGLAKAMHSAGGGLTEQTLHTAQGVMVGTPLYMSPEQAEHNNLDVDTRTDIYSLGVILYELLTGSTPLERQLLKAAAYNEILRLIKEVEPPKPSQRISSSQKLPSIAAQRSLEPVQLCRLIRGELDWIVMKSLDKQRSRRYETANALMRDVERYLNDEAVEACPPSATYRLRKFANKHRLALVTTAAFVLLLATTSGISTWFAFAASRATQVASTQRDLAQQEEQKAIRSAEDVRAVLTFLQDKVLAAARPEDLEGGLGMDVSIRAALDVAEPHVGPDFQDRPLIEASIRNVLGVTYGLLGELDMAAHNLERSRDLRLDNLGPDALDTIRTTITLALVNGEQGPPHDREDRLPSPEALFEQLQAKLGPDDPEILECMNNLARSYMGTERHEEALMLSRRVLEIRTRVFGQEHLETLKAQGTLGRILIGEGMYKEAVEVLEDTVNKLTALHGPKHPSTSEYTRELAKAYSFIGRPDRAVSLLEQALKEKGENQGLYHPNTLLTMQNLANAYSSAGKVDQAIALHEQSIRMMSEKLGPDHGLTLVSQFQLATAFRSARKFDQALPLYEKTLEKLVAKFGPDRHATLLCMTELAVAYQRVGKVDQAIPLLEQALERRKKVTGLYHHYTLEIVQKLGSAYQAAGKSELALALFEQAFEERKEELGLGHGQTQQSLFSLSEYCTQIGQPQRAEAGLRSLVQYLKENAGQDSPIYANQLVTLGKNLLAQQKPAEAESILREGLEIRERTQVDYWTTFNTRSHLGCALLGQMKHAEAEPLLLSGYEGMRERGQFIPAASKGQLTQALERLVELYTAWGKPAQAAEWQTKLDADRAAFSRQEPAGAPTSADKPAVVSKPD